MNDREIDIIVNPDQLDELFERQALLTLRYRDLADDFLDEVQRCKLIVDKKKEELGILENKMFAQFKTTIKLDGKTPTDSYVNALVKSDPARKTIIDNLYTLREELDKAYSDHRKAETMVFALQVRKNSAERINSRIEQGLYIRGSAKKTQKKITNKKLNKHFEK